MTGGAPQTGGYQSVTGAPVSRPQQQGAQTPLDPSAGQNPVATPQPAPTQDWQRPPTPGATPPPTPGAAPPTTGAAPDPAATIAGWMSSNNPQGHQDAAYWLRRISETGGLRPDNLEYWKGRFMEAPGTHVEGPTGGGFSGSNATAFSQLGLDPNTSAYNQRMRDFMLSQMQTLSGPTNADSEDIAPALSAYNTQSQRDQQQNRDATAERFYAQGEGGAGLQSGGFNTALQQGREAAAGNRANFAGTTIFNAAQAKRTQLNELLRTASSAGLTAQAQQIQQQIASIDAQLRQQGLNQNNSQFGDQLGLGYAQLQSQQNREALLAGLNG